MSDANHSLFHRLAHTPLRDALRFRLAARLDWRGMIARSELPAEIQALIVTVVHRTRLWRLERADIARELISHFQDGLDAQRSAEELIKAFGDPKAAAKLIRRAKKRNRPLAWHFARRCAQAFGVFVLIYFAAWVLLVTRKPVVSVDYAAMLNAAADAAKPEDKAWPIYKPAWIEHDFWNIKFDEVYTPIAGNAVRTAIPGDTKWPQVAPFLDRRQSLVDAIRHGAEKPFTGMPAGFLFDLTEDDAIAFFGPKDGKQWVGRKRPDGDDRIQSELLVGYMLPHLGMLNRAGTMLELDTLDAFDRHDSARVLADCHAMIALARQTQGSGSSIEQAVVRFMLRRAARTISTGVRLRPDALSDADLVALAHDLSAAAPLCKATMKFERLYMLDAIQRMYSDDGHGNGHMTSLGLKMLPSISNLSVDFSKEVVITRLPTTAALPVIAMTYPDRRELTERIESLSALWEEDSRRPLWDLIQNGSRGDAAVEAMIKTDDDRRRYEIIASLTSSSGAVMKWRWYGQAYLEATTAGIALELYRRREGHYPESLSQLVPRYLPTPPLDHSTGDPLLMKVVNGKPVIYGRGLNKTDDGGVRIITKGIDEGEIPQKGDWILYPPLLESEVVPGVAPATQPAP